MDNFWSDPWLYISIPIICALVGWGTNTLAIKMAFKPLNFVGIPPFLGWQGVIPRMADKIARDTVDTMSETLLDLDELFGKLDSKRIIEEVEPIMPEMIETIINKVMLAEAPKAWEALPVAIKKRIYKKIQSEAPDIITTMLEAFQENIEDVFDVRHMLITNLVSDIEVLCKIFEKSASAEMKFIAKSGIYFGFLFGIAEMFLWLFYPENWVLPVGGALVGYLTNVLALKMIFDPKQPKKIGPFTIHGLFFRRQDEIAVEQGMLIAEEIFNPEKVAAAVLKGPSSDKLFKLINKHMQEAFDQFSGYAKPLVLMTVGTERYVAIKEKAIEETIDSLEDSMKHLHAYVEEAMDVENTVIEKVKLLSPEQFERMIRPIFEEDEWMMTLGGGVLGLLVGCFQFFIVFGGG
ncbi:MAG: DUF445 family protein [Pseudomonadales bacterium]|nr:DUF445 family protein [Pseudomonadales bacterium]